MQFAELRGPQPSPRGGPLFAFAHSRGRSAGCDPKFAPKSQKNTSNSKKSTQIVVRYNYLYYFWASDPSRKDVNRIAVTVNLRNLQSDSNKRMSRRVVNHAPIGKYIEHCAMTGVGLLCYEVGRVSQDLLWRSNASAFLRRLILLSQVHVSSFVIFIRVA